MDGIGDEDRRPRPTSEPAATMSRLTVPFLLLAATIVTGEAAAARDLPPPDVLREIVAKLRQRPISNGSMFEPAAAPVPDGTCAMRRFTMTLASGSPAARAMLVLLDGALDEKTGPIVLMAILPHLAVDADGSPRAYHPDDPNGDGVCRKEPAGDSADHYSGVCALDNFASGDIQVFKGAQKLRGAERAAEWKTIWPLIRDRSLKPIDLKQQAPTAPEGYYFFFWKEQNLSAFFKQDVIPQTWEGFPCVQDDSSRYPGYFVAATTLRQQGPTQPDFCTQSHFIDAEHIPYFVVPDDAFGNARLGDIVVARLESPAGGRFVYGIVADTGSPEAFGEASIAFNRALTQKSAPILTGHDVLALDIHAPVAVLILGGSKAALKGDYSRQNIEDVGRSEFMRWNNDQMNPARRFDACVRALRARQ